MKIFVRQAHAKTLPMKAASILSFGSVKNDNKLLIGMYELATEASTLVNERCGAICVVDPTNLDLARHIPLPAGVFRLLKVPTDFLIPRTEKKNPSPSAVAALTDGRLALFMCDRLDSIDDASVPFLSYSTILSGGMLLDCAVNFDGRLLCSDNLGNLSLLRFATGGFHSSVDFQWRAHSSQYGGTVGNCEVWSCCWADNGQCCASGGEDALLKIWDVRCPLNGPNDAQLSNRSHSAGVVFLASSTSTQNPLGTAECYSSSPNLLFSGAYDDHLRAFDLRQFNRPISEIKLNGGVWSVERLSNDLLLVACMYGGWSIVRDLHPSFELIHSHSAHGHHLLYAATSVAPLAVGADGVANSMVASCTFNDAMLRLEELSIF